MSHKKNFIFCAEKGLSPPHTKTCIIAKVKKRKKRYFGNCTCMIGIKTILEGPITIPWKLLKAAHLDSYWGKKKMLLKPDPHNAMNWVESRSRSASGKSLLVVI